MSDWEKGFSVLIRIVFIVAFGAFLWASIHHVATFFHAFEPDQTDWTGSYALAFSIDGTALILTIGMMFFGKQMPLLPKIIVWCFIVGLTGFSWVVNWEYAEAFQSPQLTMHLDPMWRNINPILASSFAFLNLAYSIVSEFFGAKPKTVEELQAELDELTGTHAQLRKQIKENKGPGLIARLKDTAIEAKNAAKEVLKNEDDATVLNGPKTDPEIAVIDDEMIAETQQELGDIPDGINGDDAPVCETDSNGETSPEEVGKTPSQNISSKRTTEPLSVSIKEAATLLKLSESYVRKLKRNRLLKSPPRAQHLILLSSIKKYQEEHQKTVV